MDKENLIDTNNKDSLESQSLSSSLLDQTAVSCMSLQNASMQAEDRADRPCMSPYVPPLSVTSISREPLTDRWWLATPSLTPGVSRTALPPYSCQDESFPYYDGMSFLDSTESSPFSCAKTPAFVLTTKDLSDVPTKDLSHVPTKDLSHVPQETPAPTREMISKAEEEPVLPATVNSTLTLGLLEGCMPTPLGRTLSIHGASSVNASLDGTQDTQTLSINGSGCLRGTQEGERGPPASEHSVGAQSLTVEVAERTDMKNDTFEAPPPPQPRATQPRATPAEPEANAATKTARLNSTYETGPVVGLNVTTELTSANAKTPTSLNVTTELPSTDAKTTTTTTTDPEAEAETLPSDTFEAKPVATETSCVEASEDTAPSESRPGPATFDFEDTLELSPSPLVTSTPMPHMDSKPTKTEEGNVRKRLSLGAVPKPPDRKTFLRPPGVQASKLPPPPGPASKLPPPPGPASKLPPPPGPASKLPLLPGSASKLPPPPGPASKLPPPPGPASKMELKPRLRSMLSLRPPSARVVATTLTDRRSGHAAVNLTVSRNMKAKATPRRSQAQKHLASSSQAQKHLASSSQAQKHLAPSSGDVSIAKRRRVAGAPVPAAAPSKPTLPASTPDGCANCALLLQELNTCRAEIQRLAELCNEDRMDT